MATSAFKSTSRRSSLAPGDAGSSNRAAGAHRRTRSLSRCSGRFPPPPPEPDDFTTPRSKFVNKTRGSGFPEISLDDLADEFFGGTKGFEDEEDDVRSGSARSGRSNRRSDDDRFRMETESSRRRGRSVAKKENVENSGESRQQRRSVSVAKYRSNDLEDETNMFHGELRRHDQVVGERKSLCGSNRSSRQRRSLSVTRYQCGELESDTDKSYDSSKLRRSDNANFHLSSSMKQTSAHVLRRSLSQKDLSQTLDNYSSHSSSLTDEEVQDFHSNNKRCPEKTIKAVYSLEKPEHPTGNGDGNGLYEAMHNEVRYAVHEIRTEIEKVVGKSDLTTLANDDINQPKASNSFNVIAEIRRSYTNKLEESEKRKQDLLAELAAEEQRGQELTDIVRELLPVPKQAAVADRPLRSRRRSNDRTRMSKCLTEEAERYFEDFLSNVEDTDISSFDGERSDTSSTLGGSAKLREPAVHNAISEAHAILAQVSSPVETDGVLLPWLDWETSNDVTPLPCKSKSGVSPTAAQEAIAACDNNTHASSLGSWSPEGNGSYHPDSSGATVDRLGVGSHLTSSSCFSDSGGSRGSSFDMDEYLQLQRSEDILFEVLRQRQRIESGSLILCGRISSLI